MKFEWHVWQKLYNAHSDIIIIQIRKKKKKREDILDSNPNIIFFIIYFLSVFEQNTIAKVSAHFSSFRVNVVKLHFVTNGQFSFEPSFKN